MRVKICGITSLDEAKLCIDAGADALGFLVGITHLAEDKIDKKKAREIIEKIPPYVSTVAVTHLTDAEEVIDLCRFINVSTVQIHNTMSPEDVVRIKRAAPAMKIVKTFHVNDQLSMEDIRRFIGIADAILLDTKTETRLGGTGLTHDWTVSSRIAKEINVPIILAGGLKPDNLKNALDRVSLLFGVDVNSGVETDGRKDRCKVKKFIEVAKEYGTLKINYDRSKTYRSNDKI